MDIAREKLNGPYSIAISSSIAKDAGVYTTKIIDITNTPSIIVTTNFDVVDATDGLISLREAITYAGTNGFGTLKSPGIFIPFPRQSCGIQIN